MTIPRVFSLADDNTLRSDPGPEIDMLRLNHRQRGEFMLDANSEVKLDEIRGDRLEIQLEMSPAMPSSAVSWFAARPTERNKHRLFYDATAKTFTIDGSKASLIRG